MDTSSTRSSTPASFDAALSVINLQPDSPVNSPVNALPSRRCLERFIDGKTWQLLEQQANIRRGSPISPIWQHGVEYFDIDEPEKPHRWICNYCDGSVTLQLTQSTSNASRHLKRAHLLVLKRQISEVASDEVSEGSFSASDRGKVRRINEFRALVTPVNIDRVRRALIRWIVQCQIPFRGVSNKYFRDFLLCLQPSLERYIPQSHSIITDWVKEDFLEARMELTSQLAVVKSQIHLSFDIWTSPACRAILGVCAHFLAPDLTLSHALIAMREIEGVHNGENIALVMNQVIQEFNLPDKLGVFIGDNAGNIDTAVECLVGNYWPNEVGMEARRARCIAHIINLAVKAFIFGQNCEAFVTEMNDLEQESMTDEAHLVREQARWRQQGVIGKFHNICRYIRQNPQRR
jgi:hypothetical protein